MVKNKAVQIAQGVSPDSVRDVLGRCTGTAPPSRLNLAIWVKPMLHDAMATVRQPHIAETGNKGICLRDQCLGKHTSRTLARNLHQQVINLFRRLIPLAPAPLPVVFGA